MKKELLIIAMLFLLMPAFASADHRAEGVPFCGDGIVEEDEKCAYDLGLTNQCGKEGAKPGIGNHYQLGEFCLRFNTVDESVPDEAGLCIMIANCWIGGEVYRDISSRIVVIDKAVGLLEPVLIYIFDPGRESYLQDAYVKEILEGPDHYLSNFCNFDYSCTVRAATGDSESASKTNGIWEGFAHNRRPGILRQVTDFSDWFENEPSEQDKLYWFQTTLTATPIELRRQGAIFAFKKAGSYKLGIIDMRGNKLESDTFTVCSTVECDPFDLEGDVTDGHGLYVPDLEVTLHQDTGLTKELEFTTYTDENGHYRFLEIIDIDKPIRLTFTFKGAPDARGRERFVIFDEQAELGSILNNSGEPVSVTTIDIELEDIPPIFDFLLDSDLIESANIGDRDQIPDFARIHYLVARAVKFSEDRLNTPVSDKMPLNVIGNDAQGISYYRNNVNSIFLSVRDTKWDSFGKPDNAEWHEITHAIMFAALSGGKNKLPTDYSFYGKINHLGFANPGTADSYIEGFAMFLSAVMQNEDSYKGAPGDEPWIYRYSTNSTINLDNNLKVWSSMGRREDISIGTLLWDFYDNAKMYGGRDDEAVSLSIEEIWKAINKPTVNDLKDVYDALSKLVPQKALDQIFISHGAFYDKNGNKKHDDGEEVGITATGDPFLVDWDFQKKGLRYFDVNLPIGSWVLGGSSGEAAHPLAGNEVPRWGTVDADNDGDISDFLFDPVNARYVAFEIDTDRDDDVGGVTDLDGDGKGEMMQRPFMVMPYDFRRSFIEFPEEMIELNITDENGAQVKQAYMVSKFEYEDEFSYRNYESRALVDGSSKISIWVPEGATLSMRVVAGEYESDEVTIDFVTFFNNLQPRSDQGEASFQIPASNAEIVSAISAEQAEAVESAKRPDSTNGQKDDDDSDYNSFFIPFIILVLILAAWFYMRKAKRRKRRN